MRGFTQSDPALVDESGAAGGPRFDPLYRQIYGLLTRQLQSGQWAPGQMIPTEQALARQYRVSSGTVRKAIDLLVAENILQRRQGRGTFVQTHREVRAAEMVVHVRRVLDFEGVPTVLDDIWLPGTRFRGLSAEMLDAHDGPLYVLFEAEFGTRMLQGKERVTACLADAQAAEILAMTVGEPLLSVERVSETYEGEPVELRRGLYRTDRHHYLSELR